MSTSQQSQIPSLDHLILFLPVNPTASLPALPPSITKNFSLTPGGFHSDGLTSNTLITLSDGCYLELITFISPSSAPTTHWWGPSTSFIGWKDWSLTSPSTAEENFDKLGEYYNKPVNGGRKKESGEEVKWAVTFPAGENGGQASRGKIPFFCHDVTQREVRVPVVDEKLTHACGALGVLSLSVIVRDQALLEETRAVYRMVLGQNGESEGDEVGFSLGRVREVEGLGGGAKVRLRLAKSEEELGRTREKGYVYGDVVLGARDPEAKMKGIVRLDGDGNGEKMGLGGLYIQYLE